MARNVFWAGAVTCVVVMTAIVITILRQDRAISFPKQIDDSDGVYSRMQAGMD